MNITVVTIHSKYKVNLSCLRKIQAKHIYFDISLHLYADIVFSLKINECSEEKIEGL